MKTILLDMGHCLKGGDTGASGCGYREEVLTREIGYKVKSMLESNGFTVHVVSCDSSSSLSESLAYRVNRANELGGVLYVSIHLNAFNGQAYGTEVYTYGGKNLPEAERILSNICALGFYRRGIKDGSRLYVIRNTNMTGLLVECCFIDNQSDMSKFNSDDMAKAIAEGILGESVGDVTVENKPSQSDTSSNEDYSCQGKYGVITGNDVRLRDGASTNSNILGYANKGDKFKIGYRLGDWYSIYWGEHGAFISASYLNVVSGESNSSGEDDWIRRLQSECNRQGFSNQKIDGYAGINTLNGCPMLRRGASGNITKLLQERLNNLGYSTNGCEGIFGQGTENAVRKFQNDKNIRADGIVGKGTWSKLLNL